MSKKSPFDFCFPYAAYLDDAQKKTFQKAILLLNLKQELPEMDEETEYAFLVYRSIWEIENAHYA